MTLVFLLIACAESPSTQLPAPQLQPPSEQGRMVQYNKMRGYLVRKPTENGQILLVHDLNSEIKECIQKQVKTTILAIDKTTDQQAAKTYLSKMVKGSVAITPFDCQSQ